MHKTGLFKIKTPDIFISGVGAHVLQTG